MYLMFSKQQHKRFYTALCSLLFSVNAFAQSGEAVIPSSFKRSALPTYNPDTISGSQQAVKDLEDVVVIGYGKVKKKDLTGNTTSISSKDFQKGAFASPEQMLNGKVAGLQITPAGGAPGSGSTIRIRGGVIKREQRSAYCY